MSPVFRLLLLIPACAGFLHPPTRVRAATKPSMNLGTAAYAAGAGATTTAAAFLGERAVATPAEVVTQLGAAGVFDATAVDAISSDLRAGAAFNSLLAICTEGVHHLGLITIPLAMLAIASYREASRGVGTDAQADWACVLSPTSEGATEVTEKGVAAARSSWVCGQLANLSAADKEEFTACVHDVSGGKSRWVCV